MTLELSKTVNNTTPNVGEIVMFNIILTRSMGVTPITDITIIDDFPLELLLLSADSNIGTLSTTGNLLTVANFQLNEGDAAIVTATARVLTAGLIINQVNASGTLDGNEIQAPPTFVIFVALQPIPCLHPDTKVLTKNGRISISLLKEGDIAIDFKGREVPIVFNMKFANSSEFIRIEKDALGPNLPEADLIIRKGHPILLNKKPINPAKLARRYPNIKPFKLNKSVPVWSLCTEKRTFVMMQGVPVATWAEFDILSKTQYKFERF